MKTIVRLLATVALFLFAASVFVPFLQVIWVGVSIPEGRPGPETFWSFKKIEEFWLLGEGIILRELWFADYWSPNPFLAWIFGAQILTILFAVLAILKIKSWLLTISTMFNILTIFIMFVASQELSKPFGASYIMTFQAGYWIPFSSTVIFLICTILSLKTTGLLPKMTKNKR